MTDMPSRIKVGTITYTVHTDPESWMRIEHKLQRTEAFGHTYLTATEETP